MRTQEQTLYMFNELSDKAKERARDCYRREGNLDYDWWEAVYEDATNIARLMGIDLETKRVKLMDGTTRYDPSIYFSGFCSQGDGARFEGSYTYAKGALKAVKKYAPKDETLHRIALDLQRAQRPYFYRLDATIGHRGRYEHSGCMDIDVFDREDSGRSVGYADVAITEALRDFADWIYSALEREYAWLNNNEQVDDAITANEYEFDVDGNCA